LEATDVNDLDWILELADKIGGAIEDGTADRYRRAHTDEQSAFEAYARDHLNGGRA
jgi:hypothetical protein